MDRLEYNVAEFASRWRRELVPDQVKAGRQLSKETSQNVKTYRKTQLNPSSGVRDQGVRNAIKKDFDIKNKIKQVQGSAKASRVGLNLITGNKADPLLKQNKGLRSYLENRKINNYQGNTKLGKPTTAPKTLKRAPTGLNKVRANQKAVANENFKKGIKDTLKPTPTPISPPITPTPPRPVPSQPLPSVPKQNIPKRIANGIPRKKVGFLSIIGKTLSRNPVAAGAGIGAVGAGIGYGIYKKMKSDNNRR